MARTGVRRRRLIVAGLVTALVAGPVAIAVVSGAPNSVERLDLSSGAAWLVSPAQGLVTLVDGPSEQVVGSVAAGNAPDDAVSVTQRGSSAFVVNGTAGSVLRVDGATFDAGTPITFGGPASGIEVLAPPGSARGDLYVLDPSRRTAQVVDPATLDVRAELAMGAVPGAEQSVVDADGRLWTVDSDGRGLTWVDSSSGDDAKADSSGGRSDAAATDRVVLVQGRPVLVDVDGGRVGRLDDDGAVPDWSCLPVRADDDVRLLGSAVGPSVFAAVSTTGTLVRAGLDGDDCSDAVPVGAPGDRLGDVAESDRFVLVPNWDSGTTSVVDTRSDRVVAQFPLSEPGHRVELVPRDGLVFYNDLDSESAGVLTFDGTTWTAGDAVQKYDPADPGGDVLTPPDDSTVTPPVTPPPTTTPPTTPPGTTPPGTTPPTTRPPTTTPPGTTPPPTGGGGPVTTTPVVQDITVSPTLSAGLQVTFTGVVANPSGAWAWTVLDDGGATLTTSSDEGSLDFTVPAGAAVGDRIDVRLQVGTSAPLTRTFAVGLISTVTTVTVNKPTAGAGSPVTTTVIVTSVGGGPVPQGSVYLSFDVPKESPNQGWGSMDLVNGTATFGPRQFPDADQTVTARVTYTPTDGIHAGSEGSTTIQVIDSCMVVPVDDDTQADVRQMSSSDVVTVQLVNCGAIPQITWTVAPWLAVFSGGGGFDVSTTVSQQSDPPNDDSNLGAVVASIPNGSSVSFDVLGDRALVLTPSLLSCTASAPGVASFVAVSPEQRGDPDITMRLTVGGTTQGMQYDDTLGNENFFTDVVGPPDVGTWSVQALDQYLRPSNVATQNRGSCW